MADTAKRAGLSDLARTIFEQALEDCSIARAVARKIKREEAGNGALRLDFEGEILNMSRFRRVRIVALGKAGAAMLDAMLARLPLMPGCDLAGVLISPLAPVRLPENFLYFAGGHPLPNEASFAGARAVLAMLQEASMSSPGTGPASGASDTLCLFLISGGASAMMELPLDPEITLADTILFNRVLVHSGASITEMNCVRKHFSAVKGGRLALAAKGTECLSILVSDVPAGRTETISSGPTLPDDSTVVECREVLRRYELMERFPPSVRRFFASAELPETPKRDDFIAKAFVLLDANDLAAAARRRAAELGFFTVIDNTCDDWEYRAAATYLLERCRALRSEHGRVCLISVGEIAVAVPNHSAEQSDGQAGSHVGGRNQHFALYMATLLEPGDEPIAVLSAGSDGIDGNSAAAGAVIDEHTLRSEIMDEQSAGSEAIRERLEAEAQAALKTFSSSEFLEGAKALIVIGPTGNNLRDIRILLVEAKADPQMGHGTPPSVI